MTSRLRYCLAACALCAITLLAWSNSFDSGFVSDNGLILTGGPLHKATYQNLALIFNHPYWWPAGETHIYRPVTSLSYLFNYAILGNADRPAGYHWINLLLHAGNVLLVFALARRLVGDFWPSLPIAAVWAVHPVLTESVTNIVGRADLLAGMTVLAGLLLYLRSTEASGWRRMAWLAGLTAATAVGVFSKESSVAVLGIIALYELTWWDRSRLRGFLDGCLAMSPALLAMWWVRSKVLSAPAEFPFLDNPIAGANFWIGRLTALKVLAKYLGLLVWPASLSPDYSWAQIPLADGRLTDWIAWLVVAAAAVAVAFLYRRNKAAFFAAGFAFVALLPASNLVIPVGTIMAERLLYLPAVGLSVCLTLAVYAIGRRMKAEALAPVLLCLIAAGFGARTWVRNKDWRDDITFWSAAVRTSPLSFKTHLALAESLYNEHLDPDRVLSEDERGLALIDSVPNQLNHAAYYYRVAGQYVEIGDSLRRRGPDGAMFTPPESTSKYERARVLYQRCLAIFHSHSRADRGPAAAAEDAVTYLNLSRTEGRSGRNDEALRSAREAREADPMRPEPYGLIHDLLVAAGRRDEASAVLMQGLLLTSNKSLEQRLVADYADRPDEAKCAISFAEAAPALDFSCGIVRKLACSVPGLRSDLAAKYGCAH